jgi:hypothetical protein
VAPAGTKKLKIAHAEYAKLNAMIQACIKEHDARTGEESVQ